MAVNEVKPAPDQPAPQIRREMVDVPKRDEHGNIIPGQFEQVERIRGNHQYIRLLVPRGQTVRVTVAAGGETKTAEWVAAEHGGRTALADVRFRVYDNCELTAWPEPEPEPEPMEIP